MHCQGRAIEFLVNKKRKGKCEGRLLQVIEPSVLEREGIRCPHFGICGGCVSQSIPYEQQLEIKEQQVKELLDSVCSDYVFEGIKGSPIYEGYRNKMEFSFGDEYKGWSSGTGNAPQGQFL